MLNLFGSFSLGFLFFLNIYIIFFLILVWKLHY